MAFWTKNQNCRDVTINFDPGSRKIVFNRDLEPKM